MDSIKRVSEIRRGLIVAIIVFAICLCGISGLIGYRSYARGITDRYDELLKSVAELCMVEMNGDELEKCIEAGETSDSYREMQTHMNHIKASQSIQYIYAVIPVNDEETGNMKYVMAGIENSQYRSQAKKVVHLGDISKDEFEKDTLQYYQDVMAGVRESYIYESVTNEGTAHTVLVPIKNKLGKPVCVLAVDVVLTELGEKTASYIQTVTIASLLILTAFLVVMLIWLKAKVTDPLIELEHSNQEAIKEAEAANLAKSNFLFSMSHDIRTPLNAITGFTRMAKKHGDEKEKVNDYLDKIDASGKHLLNLVNQVLEMARIESGRMELDECPVSIQTEFDALATILAEQAKINGQKLNCNLVGIEHNNIYADRGRMSSVAMNIAGNAMKYTPEGGSIYFIFKENPCEKEGYATYSFIVADTGIGMSEEYQKILFEPFSREKNSKVAKIQGTGLGLSIVKSLVDLLGGTIKVESQLGKGTRFQVDVSFKINEQTTVEKEEVDYDTSIFKGRRVLLVDDNALNREIARDLLEESGFIVDEGDDGEVAVDKVRKQAEEGRQDYYDFILMDVQMPMMDGYEATKYIRGICTEHHIPIIALSANAFAEDKAASKAAGMDDHVSKPINTEELYGIMSRFVLGTNEPKAS